MIIKEKFPKKLLVEGNDDQHVIWSLCEQFQVAESFDVIDCIGINKLLDQISIRFKQSQIETVGIVIDADVEVGKRWASLRTILNGQGFTVPDALPPDGLILSRTDGKRIGVWIMPDNMLNGMLEDFISFLVPPMTSYFQLLPLRWKV
nr:DUF3226 domain-containing protein [Paraflavitalea soli]